MSTEILLILEKNLLTLKTNHVLISVLSGSYLLAESLKT